jgi:adenine phosphoribosyltransferase
MTDATLDRLRTALRDVPDFPKTGIVFKDITPLLGNPELLKIAVGAFVDATRPLGVTKVVGIESRGFIFGAPVAFALGVGFVPVRKKGKLPWECEAVSYALEYGEATIEIHRDSVLAGERVVIIDDLLATGGTAGAAAALVKRLGGEVVEAQFLIELGFLSGRAALGSIPARSFMLF